MGKNAGMRDSMITHYGLDDQHREHRAEVRAFCEDEVRPKLEQFEETGTFPRELVEALAVKGFRGNHFPAKYGGQGADYRTFTITLEEVARIWKFLAGDLNIAGTLVGQPILEHGAEWQRENWLHGLCTGDIIAALAMTEPDAGSDISNVATTAERENGEWVINGHKHWITLGSVADLLIILARTGDNAHDLSLIGVPIDTPGNHDGIEFIRDIPCMEGDAAVESELKFTDLRVPTRNLIGEENAAFSYVLDALNVGRVGTAAQGVGVAQAAYEAAREFADQRSQFDRPIRTFQGIGFKIADMAMTIEAARLMTLQAAHTLDRDAVAAMEAAMAKTYATDVAMDVTVESVQVHGARGYSSDLPVERYLREAKGMQIYEGTNEVNRYLIQKQLYSRLADGDHP